MTHPEGWHTAIEQAFEAALRQGSPKQVVGLIDRVQQAGDNRVARLFLEQARERFPEHRGVLLRLLEMHLRYKRWPDFDREAARAVAEHPELGEVYLLIGQSQEARAAWAPAADAMAQAAVHLPDDPEPVLRLARVHRVLGAPNTAQSIVEEALGRMPDVAPLHAARGYALIDQGQPAEAARAFHEAHKRKPDWLPFLDDLAGALMLCERWHDAARVAVRSLKKRARNERAWTVYAIAHRELGDAGRAEKGYRNALKAARTPSRAQGNLGLFLSSRPSGVLEAIGLLRDAAEAHPDWDEVTEALAQVRDAAKRG